MLCYVWIHMFHILGRTTWNFTTWDHEVPCKSTSWSCLGRFRRAGSHLSAALSQSVYCVLCQGWVACQAFSLLALITIIIRQKPIIIIIIIIIIMIKVLLGDILGDIPWQKKTWKKTHEKPIGLWETATFNFTRKTQNYSLRLLVCPPMLFLHAHCH